DGRMYSFGL
nr:allatostatin VII [Diploptera punctata]